MSTIASVEQAVRPLLSLKGVKRAFVIAREEDNVGSEDLPRVLVAAAREMGLSLLDGKAERQTERMLDHVVIARRFGAIVVCVVGDETMVENEIQRKFNVIAIRVQADNAKEAPSPLIPALREAYVAVAGPLSNLVFDRSLEDLRMTRGANSAATLRAFVEDLAKTVTPPGNHKLLQRAEIILRNAETPSGSFLAAALAPPTPQAFPVPSRAAAPPLKRPPTVPRMAAVQQVTREYVGPLGDLVVQRALERAGSDVNDTASADRLIDAIALQLPEHKRARFRAESRAALEAAGRGEEIEASSESLTPRGR